MINRTASIDFETYSEAGYVWGTTTQKWGALPGASQGKKGLQVVGTSVYSEHPSTEVLTMSYDLGDGSRNWQPGALPPVALFAHIRGGGLVKAWNTRFEYLIWNNVCVPKYGWPPLPLNQLRDTMAKSRAHALPGALGKAADVLGLTEQKDGDGGRLIKKFSMPRNPTKTDPRTRIRLMSEPVDGPLMLAYCDQDVRAEAAADAVIPDLSAAETEVWLLDQEVNDRGVMLDMDGVQNCIAVIEQAHAQYNAELRTLTGGTVSRASELQKLIGWLGAQGVHTASLDEEHLTELLRAPDSLPPQARRALEIRAAIGSAAVKKVFAMRNAVSGDGRLRDLYLYHGARTGRVAGAGAQPTNMPNSAGVYATRCEACERHYGAGVKDCPWCGCTGDLSHQVEWGVPAAQDALEVIGTQNLNAVEHFYGDAMQAVSGCLRSLFVAAPGHDLICSDYSSIEAVVIAMLAGEQWRIDVFRTHGKIYEMSAAKITGTSFESMLEHKKTTGQHSPLRKLGKIAELSSAYGGWTGAWSQFGADEFMSEEEMKTAILAWRAASPAIVELWGGQERNWQPELFGVEGAFITAMHYPGQEFFVRGLRFQKRGDAVYIRLPSGRELTYHRPMLGLSDRRRGTFQISFEGWNSNPMGGAVGWTRIRTYSGRLVENVVQAIARDIQWHGLLALRAAGYPTVLHVYDEDVCEVPEGFGSIEEFEAIMGRMPEWAADWPIRAQGGWRGKRYRK